MSNKIEVELADLEQVAFALDQAVFNPDGENAESIAYALEVVQGYINDATAVQDTTADDTSVSTELEDIGIDDDIPF